MLFVGETVPPLNELPLAEAAARADRLLTMVCHPERIAGEAHWTPAVCSFSRCFATSSLSDLARNVKSKNC